ncbi:predicted protein [Streptomyces viridochromogenes DSM 40736]|uniref:Predicted protein n=1 Tax=Streptomyces viridochromogenes (strain DSM 40736 / JCM 4977 / BCRC 1201 / Tue 494) TaxID=591159 RepID=D9X2K5_STRVT|nr:plantaricin C family lantibiotic [Streptomyces viridochromogenes]EFL33674.1 predicted protein [Streptomyces viridochromogenes DSM 40736]
MCRGSLSRDPAAPAINLEETVYRGDISLLEEIEEQDFAFGAGCSANFTTFSLSGIFGNDGDCCTLTKECQASCN